MYTIAAMQRRNEGPKGRFKLFQFKIYEEEIDRWEAVLWRAKERALKRKVKVTDSDINRALLGLPGKFDWLVTEADRKSFQGRSKGEIELVGRALEDDEPRAPSGRALKAVAHATTDLSRCLFCGKPARGGVCREHRGALLGDADTARAFLDDLPYGVIELDREGRVIAYNRGETEMSRLSHRKVEGKNFFTQIAPCDEVKEIYEHYDEFLRGVGPAGEFKATFPFKHGSVRVKVSFARVSDDRALVIVKKAESGRGRKTG